MMSKNGNDDGFYCTWSDYSFLHFMIEQPSEGDQEKYHLKIAIHKLYIKIPLFKGNNKIHWSLEEYKRYGISCHDDIVWFHLGKNGKTFDLPWARVHVRHDILNRDGTLYHRNSSKKKQILSWDLIEKNIPIVEYVYLTHKLKDGTIQNRIATLNMAKKENGDGSGLLG